MSSTNGDRQPPTDLDHPGEVLYHEYLKPLGISQVAFAKHLGVPFQMINEIVNRKRSISATNCWRFGQALNTDPRYWIHLQADYDLERARPQQKDRVWPMVSPSADLARAQWRDRLEKLGA